MARRKIITWSVEMWRAIGDSWNHYIWIMTAIDHTICTQNQTLGGRYMKAKLILVGVLVMVTMCTGLSFAAEKQTTAKKDIAEGSVLYVCNCGPECKCDTVSTQPGKCKCGQQMVPMHVLKIEKDEALLCTCGGGCQCKIDASDPSKCGCGKPVKRVSLKGLYVCKCGEGCSCNTISDKPGKCKCGNEMRQVK
jgi:hypothetical protein